MCGIAGVYGAFDKKVVSDMLTAEVHRGPDGEGIWGDAENYITLGHVRLSIIDTSVAGHQPMSYSDERLWITYNGEIYNYQELRSELLSIGCVFNTGTDTEVILAAYYIWGIDFLKKLRGIYAFALFDKYPKIGPAKLFLVRDRFGIKPLLFFKKNQKTFFASEVRALLASGCIDRTLDSFSLKDYLAVGAVYQPNSIVKNIKSVPSGHYIEISGNNSNTVRYWDLHEATIKLRKELKDITYSSACSSLNEILNKVTRYNLVSDVEVGAFLSGGIDSTAVVGLMSAESKSNIRTFAIGFESKLHHIDERKYANIAAEQFGCIHEELAVKSAEVPIFFDYLIRSMDQPSLDGTNTWLVSRMASRKVKVALSGLGGDELFAGYSHFQRIINDSKSILTEKTYFYGLVEKVHSLRPNFITLRLLSKLSNIAVRLSNLRRVLEDFELEKVLKPRWASGCRSQHVDRFDLLIPKDADPVQQITYVEIYSYLQNILLRDCDTMSMTHGLEVRPVLLDHELVEFVYSLPMVYKLTPNCPKKLFIDSTGDLIPIQLQNRKKMGFELPFSDWINGPLADKFVSLLNDPFAKNIFTDKFLLQQIKEIKCGRAKNSLWAFGVLIAWSIENKVHLENI
jgi:asparagine synthase (glutamine-hydrolysing)